MAQLRRLQQQFPNELVVIGIHSAKFPNEKLTENLREAVMRHGIDHPVANDADFQVWQEYAIQAWPTVLLIDPLGKIVHTQSGEILAEEFVPKIGALITEAEASGTLKQTDNNFTPERLAEPNRPLAYPSKLLVGGESQLFIADTGHHRILEIEINDAGQQAKIIRTFGTGEAGFQDGGASEAQFHDPHGLSLSGQTLYVADTENHAIRAINLDDNTVRTVAGTGQKAHGQRQMGRPTDISLRSPWAVWAENDIVLIAMAGSHQIWILIDEAQLGVFAGNGQEALVDGSRGEASFNQPSDISAGFGHLFIADAEASAIRAISLGEEATVMTLVGQGLFEYGDIDGKGGEVRLQHPTGLTFHDGLVYVADSYNHKIKTLDPTTGSVQTLIGTGAVGCHDGSFTEATLFEPEGVIARGNTLFIADTNNHLIRMAHLSEQRVTTINIG